MTSGFLRAFARDESGVSSSEYALILLVASTGLALSTFILGKAIGDSVIQTASLFRQPAAGAAAAAASDSGGVPDSAAAASPAGNPADVAEPVPGCSGKGNSQGACKGHAKAKSNR